ncbi:50S ribosomal protein L13 [Candidatus Daviesbacteria bacterium]|nr:50S ribosomal protein L13 [Candidatus Daviesbacteria bacterium]
MSTNALSSKDIKRQWHLIDAKDKILGRLATEVATILMGKNKPQYVSYLDSGDYVVVKNAAYIKVTGKKLHKKKYIRHSGYPGGLKTETLDKLLAKKPERVIEHAVSGMLPNTKLGKQMIKKLKIFAEEKHSYQKQLGES